MKLDKLAVAVALVIGTAGIAQCAHATGWHKPPMVVVKPPVPVSPPPVVVTPPPAAPVAAPAPAPAPATPAQQPTGGGGHTSWLAKGGWAFIGVGVYFSAVVYSHWIWCAEDDRKPAKERKCYRPLRDGMPS